ncbi:P-loop NTPase fold protein [Snodgrassella alvi]|uniref:KAP family P-loop NTPase fold protein n=1 Tax=Snodgrassella alvi TaxID=1196083 RepID=UPI0035166B96
MSENSLKKCVPIEIPDNNPFQNDVLNRKDNIETLTTFITSFEQSIVLCIDGGWGQGKTTFIKMWEKYLHQQSIPTIYFNAWESDYTDDALIALIGEISLSIENLSGENKKNGNGFLNTLKNTSIYLVKDASAKDWLAIGSAMGSFFTNGRIKADKIVDFTNNLGACLAKKQIEKYEKSKQILNEFKKNLSKLAECHSPSNEMKPLIIFIDELDRCRPNFAIEVLEKAKHLFNVDNIIFVLATDKSQLAHSIRAVYGQGLDVNGYLRRFIDFDYLLPIPNKNKFINTLLEKLSLNDIVDVIFYSGVTIRVFIWDFIYLYQLTLREIEAFCNILNIVARSHNRFRTNELILVFFFIIIKIKVPDIYKTYNNLDSEDNDNIIIFINNVLENIDSNYTLVDKNRLNFFEYLGCLLLSIFSSDSVEILTSTITDYLKKFNLNEEKIKIIHNCLRKSKTEEIGISTLQEIKKAIEISTNFSF